MFQTLELLRKTCAKLEFKAIKKRCGIFGVLKYVDAGFVVRPEVIYFLKLGFAE